jgi:transcriptional regulator with XRE-family HTH domain
MKDKQQKEIVDRHRKCMPNMDDLLEYLSYRLRKTRQENNMSFRALAKRVGVDHAYLYRLETKDPRVNPTARSMTKILKACYKIQGKKKTYRDHFTADGIHVRFGDDLLGRRVIATATDPVYAIVIVDALQLRAEAMK